MQYEMTKTIVSKEDVMAGFVATLLAMVKAETEVQRGYIQAVADGLVELAKRYDEVKGTDKKIEMRLKGEHFGVIQWEDGQFVMHCLPKEDKENDE